MKNKYDSKRCLRCDVSFIPTSGVQKYCSKCGALNKAQYMRKNTRVYYYKNKEKIAIRKHNWYKKNFQRIRQHQREYAKRVRESKK